MLKNLSGAPGIKIILSKINAGAKNITVSSVYGSFRSVLYSLFVSKINKNVLIITSAETVYRLYGEMRALKPVFNMKKKITAYPEDDSFIYRNIKPSGKISAERLRAYSVFLEKGRKVVLTDINALVEKIAPPEAVKNTSITLKKGSRISPQKIIEILAENEYERAVKTENIFEYSVRGNIIDIFSPCGGYPVRAEFFGDEIESVRYFSPVTNATTEKKDKIKMTLFNPAGKAARGASCVLDYFDSSDTLIIMDDVDRIKNETMEKIDKVEKYLKTGEVKKNIFSVKNIFSKTSKFMKLKAYSLAKKSVDVRLHTRENPAFKRNPDLLFDYLKESASGGFKIYMVSDNEGEAKHLREMVSEREAAYGERVSPALSYLNAEIQKGFVFPESRFVLISNREIFERYKGRARGRVKDSALRPVKHFLELSAGDYVVHRNHGIGVFEGIKTAAVEDKNADFILIKYAGGDKLYLPVYNIGLIDKYIGAEKGPALSRLGSPSWRGTKEEIERQLRALARDLLRIYAKRKAAKGISYPEDDDMQKGFEHAFIYEETPDQAKAIEKVKSDMTEVKPMDRLICGDAGFGKTEVAMRAAFKAVTSGRQVLLLTATTLLAQQHFLTFRERMADYPVNIEMLSRLVRPGKKKEIIKKAAEGITDIIIGTHSILTPSIKLKNAGLIIIDEEQHFGVKQKERLREKYSGMDTLALTATPIPRTLYFSVSGLRDISVINTPPPAKRAIETYIIKERISTVREIILREALRGGQIFYVYNDIRKIFRVTAELEAALPGIKFRTAHGRMKKNELEKIMLEFLDGRFDVLVTTTIIESGLDMPNVNTIIISSAERFGLSQLYQLRGRVGRRERQAYAYLMVKDPVLLSDTAKQRLRTIESYIDPGAGFKIAMKDLELRGAGSILGAKQHGNMEKIGFELYCSMLEEAVSEIKGGKMIKEKDTRIKTEMKAYIPEGYIWDSTEKMRFYRRIFLAAGIKEIRSIENEVRDAWGELPPEAKNIIFIGALKAAGRVLNADEIKQSGEKFIFIPSKGEKLSAAGKNFLLKTADKINYSGGRLYVKDLGAEKTLDELDKLVEAVKEQ